MNYRNQEMNENIDADFEAIFYDTIFQSENQLCIDCQQKEKQTLWVSVNNGVFICQDCAKEHQIHNESSISLIKQVSSEQWTKDQINLIALGGNLKFRALLEEYQIQDFPIKNKYKTLAALYYRMRLQSIIKQEFTDIEAPQFLEGQEIYNEKDRNNLSLQIILSIVWTYIPNDDIIQINYYFYNRKQVNPYLKSQNVLPQLIETTKQQSKEKHKFSDNWLTGFNKLFNKKAHTEEHKKEIDISEFEEIKLEDDQLQNDEISEILQNDIIFDQAHQIQQKYHPTAQHVNIRPRYRETF